MKKTKSRGKKKQAKEKELIVVDDAQGFIFESEKDLFAYFGPYIDKLEDEFQKWVPGEVELHDDFLEETLQNPDQIWKDEKTFSDLILHHFTKSFTIKGETIYYVAVTYVCSQEKVPTFIFLHFLTKEASLVEKYQRGELIYDYQFEQVIDVALEGDALSDSEPLALGLFNSMILVRSDKDIPRAQFRDFASLREETIEEADEIWRKVDLSGNVLVTFIKEFPDNELKELTYIAVTLEDPHSNVHSLLFSFPTTDSSLVDRYRQGDNLDAEEVVQESSH